MHTNEDGLRENMGYKVTNFRTYRWVLWIRNKPVHRWKVLPLSKLFVQAPENLPSSKNQLIVTIDMVLENYYESVNANFLCWWLPHLITIYLIVQFYLNNAEGCRCHRIWEISSGWRNSTNNCYTTCPFRTSKTFHFPSTFIERG